jgi:hypothetical protein
MLRRMGDGKGGQLCSNSDHGQLRYNRSVFGRSQETTTFGDIDVIFCHFIGDGVKDLIVGRNDGTIEVYSYDVST